MKRFSAIFLWIILIILTGFNGCAFLFKAPKPKTLKQRVLEQIWYISTPEQRNKLENLNTPGEINQFLEEFWVNLDPTPETYENELKSEYARRYEFVRLNYPSRCGWGMSDRGRVYMLYGSPDQIDQNPITYFQFKNGKMIGGLEIWLYDQPAGDVERLNIFSGVYPHQMKFVFADMQGVGIYTQIYSSEPNEIIDPRVFWIED